ncbi:MAG: patatin-like phospholipase family protein [Ferruginibacter sp.]|nr:patatin-like phospholipase family protein [Bacteroidota bacterium]MCW5916431.1 patatin-like phospholipase family protein [Ferruginibacter sp.]
MKRYVTDFYYSFPVQLFILHFRKYQILLLFWFILISTISSDFLKHYGADALFFVPEYLGSVNFVGAAIVGVALGVYIMSWNVTTFILHSKRFKFLATTRNPFLKYCINNALFPILFVLYYFGRLYWFSEYRELMTFSEIMVILLGILLGLALLMGISLAYFFGADKTIVRTMAPIINSPELFNKRFSNKRYVDEGFGLKVGVYLSGHLRWKKARNVSHYRQDFLDTIFKRHHLAAIASIVLAFLFLILVGFLLDNSYFELPAAASILVFFAILIAVIGSLTYFLESWSLPAAILLLVVVNVLYEHEIIDPRNKAYGIDYTKRDLRPDYDKQSLQNLCTNTRMKADEQNMLGILNRWKARQKEEKPLMVFINVSGGGLRSAAFVMNALQKMDSITQGKLMEHSFLFSGASGGMLAASYYRELYRLKLQNPKFDISKETYTDNIAKDLLNPVFTSMIARDLFSPAQRFSVDGFSYVKDRGYAFEKKLSDNTNGLLDKQMKDLSADEHAAKIPLIIFNSVVTVDGRKMVMGTQPMSFMMKPPNMMEDSLANPDAVDFNALFKNLQPQNLRILTALRMSATFPYVLPNVWLPTNPVVDVMDAGLRDNYGMETTLRFIDVFRNWLKENTSGVVILQLKDRVLENVPLHFDKGSVTNMIVTPATMLQQNWFRLQDYAQSDEYNYITQNNDDLKIQRLSIMYLPQKPDKGAVLNFHLTAREKRDVKNAFYGEINQKAIATVKQLLSP